MLHSSRLRRPFQSFRVVARHRRLRRLLAETLEARTVLAALLATNELLVQFKAGVSDAAKAETLAAMEGAPMESLQKIAGGAAAPDAVQRIAISESLTLDEVLAALNSHPLVEYAEPNWLYQPADLSNDTNYLNGGLWGMYSDDSPSAVGPSGTTNAFGSQAEEAWAAGYTGDRSVVIGIIDEGFQHTHPDLINNTWTNPFDPVDGVDNDGNGYIDDIHGWDFFNNDNTVYDGTGDDHGTHVAGTIGGEGGNGLGVAGVNWQTTMISAKFLGPNGGYTSDAVEALDYLTDLKLRHGVNIVATNNSWGGGGYSQALLDAITRAANAGILFIAAAGNAGVNNDSSASYPSNYNTTAGAGYDAVIAVAAIASNGSKASFSSYGATSVDLGAPGVSINSTLPTNGYGSYSGTSMATPHVTGAAALYAAYHPDASAAEIKAAILGSTTPTTSLSGLTVTGGRLNISALMEGGGEVTPSLSINDVSITEGNSGTKSLVFTVTLSAAFGSPVTVDYATTNGTASSGSDYAAAAGTLTFAPGVLTQTVSVTINGDTAVEANETLFVHLTAPTNATIGDGQGQGTIVNDDTAPAGISINDVSIVEGNSGRRTLTFTIYLPQAATSTVRVNYATANGTASAGSDYRSTSGRAMIRSGRTSTTVSVTIYGDRAVEGNETFFVNLSNPVNATISDSQGVGTIVNDDSSGGANRRSFFWFSSDDSDGAGEASPAERFDALWASFQGGGGSPALAWLYQGVRHDDLESLASLISRSRSSASRLKPLFG